MSDPEQAVAVAPISIAEARPGDPGSVDPDVYSMALALSRQIQGVIGAGLAGIYLHGSVATGDFAPNKSDIDIIVVCQEALSQGQKGASRDALAACPLPTRVAGIDYAVLSSRAARYPRPDMIWELILQARRAGTTVEIRERERVDPQAVLDIEMARTQGIALLGADPRHVFTPAPAAWILEACTRNVRTWADRSAFDDPASGVLNACRAWRYLEEGVLCGKTSGGEWARARVEDPTLINGALEWRHGAGRVRLPDAEVEAFCQAVLRLLETAHRKPGSK